MTEEEQVLFQDHLTQKTKQYPQLYGRSIKEIAQEALGVSIGHWRNLSKEQARQVLQLAPHLYKDKK